MGDCQSHGMLVDVQRRVTRRKECQKCQGAYRDCIENEYGVARMAVRSLMYSGRSYSSNYAENAC